MRTIRRADSVLLVVDVQGRLMPAIGGAEAVVRGCGRLVATAGLLGVKVVATEQNPAGLGPTVAGLLPEGLAAMPKMHFDACREAGFLPELGGRGSVVVAGCEAHVCVQQTVLGLLDAGRRVFVVADAVGSRVAGDRDAALARMGRHGAEVVTVEMVVFEWLETAADPAFRAALRVVK